jgi:biopolymer transport protein ExbB
MEAVKLYVQQGGIFMYPIIAFTFWAFMLIIERAIFFWQTTSNTSRLTNKFCEALDKGGVEEASLLLKNERGIFKDVLGTALENSSLPTNHIEKKIDTVLTKELPVLKRYLNLIAVLAGLMPMLGLLGTVSGMITTFRVIALQGTGDAQAMADGISEALITTEAGLVAAIPIILFHTLLNNRAMKIVAHLKTSVSHFLEHIECR